MALSDCPDMNKRNVDGDGSLSSVPCDATDRNDLVTCCEEFFGHKANVQRSIEIGEKAIADVLEPFEMAGADGHPVR